MSFLFVIHDNYCAFCATFYGIVGSPYSSSSYFVPFSFPFSFIVSGLPDEYSRGPIYRWGAIKQGGVAKMGKRFWKILKLSMGVCEGV